MNTFKSRGWPDLPSLLAAAAIAVVALFAWGSAATLLQLGVRRAVSRARPAAEPVAQLPFEVQMLIDGSMAVLVGDTQDEAVVYRVDDRDRSLGLSRELVGLSFSGTYLSPAPAPGAPRASDWIGMTRSLGLQNRYGPVHAIHDGKRDGSVYFGAYDRETKRLRGYVGRDGYRGTPPPLDLRFHLPRADWQDCNWTQPVSGPSLATEAGRSARDDHSPTTESACLFLSDGALYRLDPGALRATRVTSVPGARGIFEVIVGRPGSPIAADTPTKRFRTALVTYDGSRLTVHHRPGPRPVGGFRVPPELDKRGCYFHLPGDGTAVFQVSWYGQYANGADLLWATPDGTVVRRRTVRLRDDWPGVPYRVAATSTPLQWPNPLVVMAMEESLRTSLKEAHIHLPDRIPPPIPLAAWLLFGLICLLTLASAGVCWSRQRRYCQGGTWVWVAFVLLLGPPGWLGYRYSRPWPHLAPCPACGKKAPRDRPACAFCGADFPPASATGTEIYDGWRTAPE